MKTKTTDKETEFVIFCIENVAKQMGLSGSVVYKAFKETGGIEGFLYPSYEALHTQSRQYIVDEVMSYMRNHHATNVLKV